jgi:hypothetical protein
MGDSSPIRKRLMGNLDVLEARPAEAQTRPTDEIDLAKAAIIHYSSEDPAHPIENLLDGRSGAGATYWASSEADTPAQILLEFEQPQSIHRLMYDVEERRAERTQEVQMEVSTDGGRNYRQVFVQQYNFSPRGATHQRESMRLDLREVTHLRFTIVPNLGGAGRATLTSLRLFAWRF